MPDLTITKPKLRVSGFRFTYGATVPLRLGVDQRAGAFDVVTSLECTGEALFSFIDVELSQKVGRIATIRGFGSIDVVCDGVTHQWSATVSPESGEFRGGKGASVTFAVACGVFECGLDFEERLVQLSRRD